MLCLCYAIDVLFRTVPQLNSHQVRHPRWPYQLLVLTFGGGFLAVLMAVLSLVSNCHFSMAPDGFGHWLFGWSLQTSMAAPKLETCFFRQKWPHEIRFLWFAMFDVESFSKYNIDKKPTEIKKC